MKKAALVRGKIKMKIIYLADSYARIPGEKAHSLQIMKMCQAFKGLGLDVRLLIPQRINPEFKNINAFDYYKIAEKFPIKKLWLLDLVDWKWLLGRFSSLIQNITFAVSSFFYFLFKKADIIYCRDEFSLFFLSFFKKNFILELHAFPQNKFFLHKQIYKKAKKIIVINGKLKELFIGLGIEQNKILTAPDGVDLEQFDIRRSKEECRKDLGLPLNKKLVVYTGHLFKWKGVYALAKASQFLDENYQIVFVGGMKDDRMRLEKFIKRNKFNKIMMIEHQPPFLIPLYLKSADVLVLPNSSQEKISRLYTSPIKMFEYMASGVPIVASDLPSIREVLNERNCFLFEPDKAEDLASKIKLAVNDKERAQQAFIDVQKYSWQKRAENILGFINS